MTNKEDHYKSSSGRGGYRENAGRKSSWKHKDTCTIRIPKTFAQELVELAHRLDNGERFDNDTESKRASNDTVTKSMGVDDTVIELAHRRDNELKIDNDTESKLQNCDIVTQSMCSDDSVSPLADQQAMDASIDTVTNSQPAGDDNVTLSIPLLIQKRVGHVGCTTFTSHMVSRYRRGVAVTAAHAGRDSSFVL